MGQLLCLFAYCLFEGNRFDETQVLLNWQTATEVDNKGFEIQQSWDAKTFRDSSFCRRTRQF